MTSPIASPLRSPSPFSNKVSSSFASRKAEAVRPRLREELQNHIYYTLLDHFLEHVLAVPAGAEWEKYFDAQEHNDVLITLRNAFTKKFAREPECYKPFTVMANYIREHANATFPPGPEAVPGVKFAATGSKILQGDVKTPDRKPDVVLAEGGIAEQYQDDPETKIQWHHILVAFEFKLVKKKLTEAEAEAEAEAVSPSPGSSNISSPVRSKRKSSGPLSPKSFKKPYTIRRGVTTKDQLQVADYAHEMFSSSNNTRRHALAIYVEDDLLRLWYYDRCGGIASHKFVNIKTQFRTFIKIIIAITRLRLTDYGYFPIFDWPPGPAVPHSLEGASLTLGTHRVTFTDVISTRTGIVTRASLVWGVTCDTLPESVVKISFQQVSRTHEVEIIEHALQHHIDHLPTVYLYQDFDKVSQGIRSRLPRLPELQSKEMDKFQFDDRVLRVIVFKRYTPVFQLKTLSQFKNVIRDVFDCMVQLHEKAGILHRDISHTNIMADETNGSFRGILNDFDLAVRNNSPDRDSRSLERTGTLPFMALKLLQSEETIPHLFRHDVESLFNVLVWIAVQYDGGKRVKTDQLKSWTTESFQQMALVKEGFWKHPMKDLKLTNFYSDLETILTLYAAVVKKLQMEPTFQTEKQIAALKGFEEEMMMEEDGENSWSWVNQMVGEVPGMSDRQVIRSVQKLLHH